MKCLSLISLITFSQFISLSHCGLFRRNKQEEKGDVVVIAAGGQTSPVVYKGQQGLNILLSGGGGGSDSSGNQASSVVSSSGAGSQVITNNGGQFVSGGSNPGSIIVNGGNNGDLATSASEPEPSSLLSSMNPIAKSLTDLVTSESSQSTARLSTPELFNKLMKMPASKFDRIADKLIQDALTGTTNSILSSNGQSNQVPSGAGSSASASSISSRTVPFIPLQTATGRAGLVPSSLMSSFLPPALKIPLMMAAAASSPAPVPIATIRLPVYVPDDDNDSFEESPSNSNNRPNDGGQGSTSNNGEKSSSSSSSGVNFDESKIPPPVLPSRDQQQYDDQASFERPNFDRQNYDRPSPYYDNNQNYDNSYNDRPRAEPYSSTTHIEHSTNADSGSESGSFPPSTSAHSDHRPYTEEERKEVVHSYSSSGDGGQSNDRASYNGNSNRLPSSNYNRRPTNSMTSASNAYPLLPSYTQSLPFTAYPIPITAFNSLSPNSIPIFAASSMSAPLMSKSNPFSHSSAHPLTHLNKLLHNGYVSDIRKIPQPFTYNHNHGLGPAARGLGGNSRGSSTGSTDYDKMQATLAQQMLAASSTSTRSSRGFFSRPSFFPSFRPLFGSNSVLSKTFAKPPTTFSVPFGSTPIGQATRKFGSPPNSMTASASVVAPSIMSSGQKMYPILDTSSSTPKIYHAPHNPVDILKIFADAYGKQGIPDVGLNKYSSRSSSGHSSTLASSLFKTRSIFSKPLLTSRSGIEKGSGPELKAIVTILPTEASFPSNAVESTATETDTIATETRHFPIFVKAENDDQINLVSTQSPVQKSA